MVELRMEDWKVVASVYWGERPDVVAATLAGRMVEVTEDWSVMVETWVVVSSAKVRGRRKRRARACMIAGVVKL